MLQIGLDLSYKTVGIACIDKSNNLLYHSIEINSSKYKGYSNLQFQNEIVNLIWEYFKANKLLEVDTILYIEDVFSGINPKATINTARVQGAVIDRYSLYTNKLPKLIMAVTARKNIGINAKSNKAEIQLYIIDKFKLGKISDEVRGNIISFPIQYARKRDILQIQMKTAGLGRKKLLKNELKMLKKEYDKSMSKLSTEIKKQTNINEHIADAIVLAMQTENT